MESPAPAREESFDSSFRQDFPLNEKGLSCLRTVAARYVWWKTPEEAMLYPGRAAAQVMNLGTLEDAARMTEAAGEEYLRRVLPALHP